VAKATLTLADGAVVDFESTDEGIAKILALYNSTLQQPAGKKRGKVKRVAGKQGVKKPQAKEGLQTRTEELITAGFFKAAKTPPQVAAQLLTKGFKHSSSTVSTVLIRLVKAGRLDRHWNDETKRWNYINL